MALFAYGGASAAPKCEIRGHMYDKKNNKPLSCGFVFKTADHKISEYVPTDKHGAFVIFVKDTGNYYFSYIVGQCKTEIQEVVIRDTTPYIVTIDFYVSTWDAQCPADRQVQKPRILFRPATARGWRAMIDASLVLRLKPKKRNAYQSHSVAIGAEWNYGFSRYLFGPKVGYTYLNECFAFTGITVGVNGVYFFDRAYSGLYLQPQLGYEGLETLEIFIQYNYPLIDQGIGYRLNRLSFGFRIWMYNP
jgi:hypothetical protein